jgi:hypothetical protein
MPRVVPSQVVELIDNLYPQAISNPRENARTGPQLAAIVDSARAVPPELLALTGQDLTDYVVALAMIENTQQHSLAQQRAFNVTEYRDLSPIVLLRQAMAKCPDEASTPTTTELLFIDDTQLRESIRRDISAANQDMVNGEWKGATVLAGSATEALLLWGIEQKAGSVAAAVKALVAAGTLPKKPHSNPEQWTFIELIEVALQLTLITARTATQARLGKDFRNLIHPGRAARLGQVCDRATALSALAGVEHVVRDLTP